MRKAKIVFLGSSNVGKTSIINRFVNDSFDITAPATTQAVFFMKAVDLGDIQYNLLLNDTAGQEQYHSLTPIYYRDANCAAVVYDITDTDSFNDAKRYITELRASRGDDLKIVLVGNKSDLNDQRAVSLLDADKYAEKEDLRCIEASAKTGESISNIFEIMIRQLSGNDWRPSDVIEPYQTPGKSGCC